MNVVRHVGLAATSAVLMFAAVARGQDADGVYGRLDGDLGLQIDVGATMADWKGAAFGSVTVRYVETVGMYGTWMDDFRSEVSPTSRSGSWGIELRPLFLPRFLTDREKGPATVDLLIDSFSLRAGAVVSRLPGYELSAPGFEAGLGLGFPLQAQADGLWLGAGATWRWSHAQLASRESFAHARALLLTVTIGWKGLTSAGIADVGDRPLR